MSEVPINLPYHGLIVGSKLVRSVPMKLYFADFIGREPEKYQWAHAGLSPELLTMGLEAFLLGSEHFRVPHIAVAFPHITTVYRFGDPRREEERETNMYLVGKANTSDQERISPFLKPGKTALGCLLELNPILSQEASFWASSPTVHEYLTKLVPVGSSMDVVDSNKLRNALEQKDE